MSRWDPFATALEEIGELDELVMHCLQKGPAKRFQSAGEVLSYAQAAGLV